MKKSKSPKKYTSTFKLNVVLEAYATGNASGTAAKHGLHITQINNWKRQLLSNGHQTFEPSSRNNSDEKRKIEELEKELGRYAFENSILKKTAELLT